MKGVLFLVILLVTGGLALFMVDASFDQVSSIGSTAALGGTQPFQSERSYSPQTQNEDIVQEQGMSIEQPVKFNPPGYPQTSSACKADVPLIIDTTYSMEPYIGAVKAAIHEILVNFNSAGKDYAVGGVSFGDEIRDSMDLTKDFVGFETWVNGLVADGGGDIPENQLDALWKGTELVNYRPDSRRIFLLFTDAPYHNQNDGGDANVQHSYDAVKAQLLRSRAALFVFTDETAYDDLITATGGQRFGLTQDPSQLLNIIAAITGCTIDLSISGVVPIQSVAGVPMIRDKSTMVRVKPLLADKDGIVLDGMRLDGVKMRIVFNRDTSGSVIGPTDLSMTLVNFKGRTYVTTKEEADNNLFSRERDYWDSYLKSAVAHVGIDAFNFKNVGRPEEHLVISALIDPDNTVEETNEGNNDKSYIAGVKNDPPVKRSRFESKPYKLFYKYAKYEGESFKNLPSETDPRSIADNLWEFQQPTTSHLISTYPIPDRFLRPIASGSISSLRKSGFRELDQINNLKLLSIVCKLHGYDKCVYVVPEGSLDNPTGSRNGLSWSGVRGAVFVDEVSFDSTVAHEIGHSYDVGENLCGLFGAAHCDIPMGEGWNVLRHETHIGVGLDHLDPTNLITKKERSWGTWIAEPEYKVLMDELVMGGDDPRILLVSGLIYQNDTTDLDPFLTIDGIPDDLLPGNYSFQCLSPSSSILCDVPFQPVFDNFGEFNASIFSFAIPFPDGTARIVLKKLDTPLKDIPVSPSPPTVIIDSLHQVAEDAFDITWHGTDPDWDQLTFFADYTHNGEDFTPLTFEPLQNANSTLLINTSFLPGSAGCFPPPNGIISWWPAEESAEDIVSGYNGTLMNGTGFAIGKVDQAFSLDGVDDHVRVSNSPIFDDLTKTLTLETWIYPSSTEAQMIMVKRTTLFDEQWHFRLWPINGSLYLWFEIDEGGQNYRSAIGSVPVPINQWSHVAAVYDKFAGVLTFYVNGIQEVKNFPFSMQTTLAAIDIGALTGFFSEQYFDGFIDEPSIYNASLTALQIRSIFFSGSSGKCKEGDASQSRVRITATDGVNTASAFSDPLISLNKPPSAHISLPLNRSVFGAGTEIEFRGSAFDPENSGLIFSWNSSLDSFLSNELSFSLSTLSIGTHSISLAATDAAGISASNSIALTVTTDTRPDLRIVNISLDKRKVEFWENFTLTVDASNIISDAIADLLLFDGPPENGTLIDEQFIFIRANERRPFLSMLNFPNTTSRGNHAIFAVINNTLPQESDTSNNAANITITTTPPMPFKSPLFHSPSCEPPPVGVIAWWPGDGTTDDIAGNNDVILQNGAGFDNGKVAQAFAFDGLNDYANSLNPMAVANSRITIEGWVFDNDVTRLGKIFKLHTTAYRDIWMDINEDGISSQLSFGIYDSSGVPHVVKSGFPLTQNTWHHFAGTYDGSVQNLYMDGVLVNSLTWSGSFLLNDIIYIGRDILNSQHLNGRVDEITIYDLALSSAEIQDIFDAEGGGKCKP